MRRIRCDFRLAMTDRRARAGPELSRPVLNPGPTGERRQVGPACALPTNPRKASFRFVGLLKEGLTKSEIFVVHRRSQNQTSVPIFPRYKTLPHIANAERLGSGGC